MPAIRTYDANGNLTHDGRQDLDIRWNIFNLASGAETHDGGSLTLARLSDGTLFAQQKENGGNTTGKRYCGSFVFTTGTGNTTPQVECVAWDEGRIFADAAGNYHDCWFAGDHLGNIRSVLDITPDVTFPVPLEQNDYLPFGTKIANPLHAQMGTNRWRYAGKEEFPDLNLLDFGARMYDPFTARWTAVDPMAGKYTSMSPYMYCAGNPLNIIDPQGDTTYVLFAAKGALGFGHIAIAVQDQEGNYLLYSKNGYDEGGKEATKSIIGRRWGSESNLGTLLNNGIQSFLDSAISNSVDGDHGDFPYYTEAYMIPTNQEQDTMISNAALEAISRPFSFLTGNCAHVVVQSLSSGKVSTISIGIPLQVTGGHVNAYLKMTVPRLLFQELKNNNPGGKILKPGMK